MSNFASRLIHMRDGKLEHEQVNETYQETDLSALLAQAMSNSANTDL
jgi:hypothetical protein